MATSKTQQSTSEVRIYEEPYFESESPDDVFLATQDFTCEVDAGLVAGTKLNMMWSHDAPRERVWPYAKDFNLWQNVGGYYYSAVLGDIEGQPFSLGFEPSEVENVEFHDSAFYKVEKVIPEYVLIVSQPVLTDEQVKAYGMTGYGGYSAGYHVLTLNDFGGKTTVAIATEHASVMARPGDPMTREEALAPVRNSGISHLHRWRDLFIPKLKQLVDEGA